MPTSNEGDLPEGSPTADDLCPRLSALPPQPTQPAAPPIYLSSVYRCGSPDEAARLLSGEVAGYVYSRDGHPNADLLAEKCRELHRAERATVCSSGMAALALAALAHLQQGQHVVVSNQLYGRSSQLFATELPRLGIEAMVVDTCELAATAAAFEARTRLLVVETITNPRLRVSNIAALADLAHQRGALLLVDNTFATPVLCRPLELGADLVVESLTKLMSGHSDVLLGLLCGRESAWQRVVQTQSNWGWSTSPFDCWLALRGIGTLALRAERAGGNALAAARYLESSHKIAQVDYPGLAAHPDHAVAARQFGGRFGNMVTLTLKGGQHAAEQFIAGARQIAFCPSLGDLSTTLSHPASTSHRSMSDAAREALGISTGTVRLSVGIESSPWVQAALAEGLGAVD